MVDGENLTVPTSLWDLTDEEWNGKVRFFTCSSPGRAFMTATVDYLPMTKIIKPTGPTGGLQCQQMMQ